MKTAFAVWNNRIAPVFDAARCVIVVESEATRQNTQTPVLLDGDQPLLKAQQLSALGAESLVCGAISRALQAILTARGIRVVPFIAGDVQDVIAAWRRQDFPTEAFTMPGHQGNCRRRSNHYQHEENSMPNNRTGGGRRMGGRRQGGQGRCGQNPQATNRSVATDTETCSCGQCGYSEAHERGTPCMQKKCPQCGALMSRQ